MASASMQAELLSELRDVGVEVDAVWDLVNSKAVPARAVPVLVEWLERVNEQRLLEAIVRSLATRSARGTQAGPALIRLFRALPSSSEMGLRWAVGNSIEVLADDQLEPELLKIAEDRTFGRSREMVVLGLGRLRGPEVRDVLLRLLDDDQVAGHALKALARRKDDVPTEQLARLLEHRSNWVRKEATKLLDRARADTSSD